MAGESPDRSKKRESSVEPTSGSAGSVPEARDPRLAVAREKDSSGGGTDMATKVLTVRAETPAEPDEPAGAENSPASGEDAALRAAVSAWVREPGTNATAKSGKTEAENEAKSEDDTDANSGAPSNPKAKPETSPGADASAEAATGDKAAPAGRAKSGPGATPETEAERETPSGTAADTEATSDEPTDADGAETDAATAIADAGTKADATDEDDAADKDGADADAKRDMNAKNKPATTDAEAKADTEADADAKTKPNPKTVTAPNTTADADSANKPAADSKTDASTKRAAGAKADASANTDDAKNEAEASPKTDAGAKGGSATKSDTDASAEDNANPKPDTKVDGAAAEGGVDQPTTVFKAVQPKKPRVDQPTTMLKLGGTPKDAAPKDGTPEDAKPKDGTPEDGTPKDAEPKDAEPKDAKPKGAKPGGSKSGGSKSEASAAPAESDPERTSKFVALKNDMRPAGKPRSAVAPPVTPPDATTPVPQVGPERTTQQPLPPKPPLDLLAELTNTPPPPETPVRTVVRRVKIWTPLVLLLAIVFAVVQTFRPLPSPTLSLTAKDTYTFDGKTNLPWPGEGQGWLDGDGIGTMGSFGKQTPVAIGSVAKTMTSYIILRDHPLKPGQEGPKIKIDPTAEKEGGYNKDGESTLDTVKAGQSLTQRQALSAVLIPSANNIARLLARWDAGSEAAFVKKMNATAKELGMTHTTYTDPSGLKETTVSTAGDQVKLGRAFVKVPALVAITSSASWTDPSGKYWDNTNHLPYNIGALGIKTGSTSKAGGNLLFASRKKVGGQTVTLVGAILGQHKPKILETANKVSQTALLAAQDALTSSKILKKGDVVGYVDDGLGGHTPIVITKDVTAVGWAGLKVKLSFASGTVPHTAKAGTQVGTLTVGDGSAGAVKVPVALQKDLAEPGFGAKLTRLG
ncbi:D-alanyl-D-alanine carboxypeptidase [Streptomyces sp. Caat 7-52]|uniref:D-alanyl-D-alanine carboxypeptidase n=1 Tax=Streptomyces sp. Caat 7-52 TaxID=2949637 RepID=UPI0020357212|nr:D-alanyl-D-alanine carboxypeptidase [Streptomyces sp. Caat 7-52]